jgi:tetratricopeptide (TPR) repeat protein
MGRRKPKVVSRRAVPPPAVPPPPAPLSPRRRFLRLAALVLLFAGAVGWGAWALLGPKPLTDARAALARRDFRTADDILAARLADEPDDRAARLLAAQTARRAGDFGRAREHLDAYADRFRPDDAHAHESQLLALHAGNLAGSGPLFLKYTGRAGVPGADLVMEAYLEGHLRTLAPPGGPLDPDADAGLVTRLRAAADVWLAARPGTADQAQGRVWHGRIAEYARDRALAVAKFREALELDPGSYDARLHLALALGPHAPAEGVHHLEQLRAADPGDRRVRFFLATAYRASNRPADARRLLDEALKDDPDDVGALMERAGLDLDAGRPGDAQPLLLRALGRAPTAPEVNLALSRCQQLAGRPAEAEKYRKRFEELDAARTRPRPAARP